jgi:hypothetical protein
LTGFLVDGVESAAAPVTAALRLDPRQVTAPAPPTIYAPPMVDDYLRVYEAVI